MISCAMNLETKEGVVIKKIGNDFDNRIDAKRAFRKIKLICHMDHDNTIVFIKRGAYLLKCGRRGKPKLCPFRLP
ncbi:hypothetical protein AAHE18_16G113400 [Arachis hypogaea]